MTDPTTAPPPFVIGTADLAADEADALLDAAVVTVVETAVFEVTGPGAVACIQGLFTNDIDKPGEGGFVYGAVLTPKGMIVSDLWAARDHTKIMLFASRVGAEALHTVFQRSLPPRLARATDRTFEFAVVRIAGPGAYDVTRRAGIAIPGEGRTATAIAGETVCQVARPAQTAPFALQFTVHQGDPAALLASLEQAGACAATPAAIELSRILTGWPRLGAEIDGKTLPQEVRFEENGGVSYTKGCYTGQETVARIHFRGHPNRHLVGLVWDEPLDVTQSDVRQDDRVRGRVTSAAWLAPLERFVGLGVVRREVDRARAVSAAGMPAGIVDLPFTLDE